MADVIKQEPIRFEYSDGSVVYSNVRSKRDNSTTSYSVVSAWYDGTSMDDSKVDDFGVYSKVRSTGEYIRENLPNWGETYLEVDSIGQLRSLDPYLQHLVWIRYYKGVQVNGYWTSNDTPAPIKYHLTDTSYNDDGGSVIEVGFMKLYHLFLGPINVRYFGAKCDGFSDWTNNILTGSIDTPAWKNALQYIKNSNCRELTFDGISRTDETLVVNFSGLVVTGNNVETARIIKSGNHMTSGYGIIDAVNYDGIDAVFMTLGYRGDFTFRNLKIEARDNSDYCLFFAKTYRFVTYDVYLWGAKENLRMFQYWNVNLFKTRSQGIPLTGSQLPTTNYAFRFEGYPLLPNGEPDLNNPYQSTSIHMDNCYAERSKFGFKAVNSAYFSGNALSCDGIFECSYWFQYCVGSLNGVGTEKSRGQLIRNWESNMTINGHQVLEIRNYTGTPEGARSKAKIEVSAEGRSNTGLILNGSVIRGYPSGYRAGDAEWLYVGSSTSLTLKNWNHAPILNANINGRTITGIFERDNFDGYVRTQHSREYKINDLEILPYSYAYNQTRAILRTNEVVLVNTREEHMGISSLSVPMSDLLKVFPDFNTTDGFIRDFFQFKIKYSGSVSYTPFSRDIIYFDSITRSQEEAATLQSVVIEPGDPDIGNIAVFNLSRPVNRPIVTITRLHSLPNMNNATPVRRGLVFQSENISEVDVSDGSPEEAIIILQNKMNELIEKLKNSQIISNL